MPTQTLAPLTLALLLSTLIGCGGGGGSGSDSSDCGALSADLKVFNGQTCNADRRTPVIEFAAIVQDGDKETVGAICTGSLVTLTKFITSGHCFLEPAEQFGKSLVGFKVGIDPTGKSPEVFVVTDFKFHPLYNGQIGSPYDIAMGTLDRIPNPPIGPLPIIVSAPTVVGDTVTTFGYGTSNHGEVGTLKAASFHVDGFDTGNIVGTLADSGISICQGDSGGPLVKAINGLTGLVGVNSVGLATADECAASGSRAFGFVNIQNQGIAQFIQGYAPDAAFK